MLTSETADSDFDLAIWHEAGHCVINALKGRIFRSTRLWQRGGSFVGFTDYFGGGTPLNAEACDLWGVVYDKHYPLSPPIVATDPIHSEEASGISLSLEDDLINLAAGIEAEAMRAAERGLDEASVRRRAISEPDHIDSVQHIREAGRQDECEVLLATARFEARMLLTREDVWMIVGKLAQEVASVMQVKPWVDWQDISFAARTALTELQPR